MYRKPYSTFSFGLGIVLLTLWLCSCTSDALPINLDQQARSRNSALFAIIECPFEVPEQQQNKPECGVLTVPEDRENPTGPALKLAVTIYKSRGDAPKDDPVLVLSGNSGTNFGPGSRSLSVLGNATDNRDVVMVSLRGTGYSQPVLNCEGQADLYRKSLLDRYASPAIIQDTARLQGNCRQQLSDQGAHLDAYTTAANIADLRDLRAALGYSQWNIYASGYGARLALELVRAEPQAVRSLIMESAIPPQVISMEEQAKNADAALNLVFSRCAEDTQCNAAFPNLKATFYNLVDDLNANPITVQAADLTAGERFDVLVDGYRLIDALLAILPNGGQINIPQIPRMIFQVKEGNTKQLAEFLVVLARQTPATNIASTIFTCADDWAFTSREKVQQARGNVEPALGEYFLLGIDTYQAVCEVWKQDKPSALAKQPVNGNTPALILAGDYNWPAPPAWAKRAAETLPAAVVVEFSGAGQLRTGRSPWSGCIQQIGSTFLENPATKPDTSCAEAANNPIWITLP